MPRATLTTITAADSVEAPLSVAAVAVKLGVSASTLRTWERRYGMGPTSRRSGAHRRYTPEDVALLKRMVEMIRSGVAASEAAKRLLNAMPGAIAYDHTNPPAVEDILRCASSGELTALENLLGIAIAANGLVHTWADLLEPALDRIYSSEDGQKPGYAPSAMLTVAVLRVLAQLSHQCDDTSMTYQPAVIVADHDVMLAAHVTGVALEWNGIPTSILDTGQHAGQEAQERLRAHLNAKKPHSVIMMGRGARCETLIESSLDGFEFNIILVSAEAPRILDPRIQRVRSLAACVEEMLALSREEGPCPDLVN
ncbi:MerR family transcriptional regulator [Schaalia sp. Marseille-Q2122]|uniref:MerR family transcriptional regulator n=1 Tax=Schaalia sp. Marseille-Q2122 TaxID=2736604 RepID=UPI00158B06C7|nr:MerR family transcriptional regulator [Schaalia sp. Marseille-Q2122]